MYSYFHQWCMLSWSWMDEKFTRGGSWPIVEPITFLEKSRPGSRILQQISGILRNKGKLPPYPYRMVNLDPEPRIHLDLTNVKLELLTNRDKTLLSFCRWGNAIARLCQWSSSVDPQPFQKHIQDEGPSFRHCRFFSDNFGTIALTQIKWMYILRVREFKYCTSLLAGGFVLQLWTRWGDVSASTEVCNLRIFLQK